MRRLLLLPLLALAFVGGKAQAVAPVYPCYGPPADYVSAFDFVDGTTDGAVSYPEPRAFIEFQGHVIPPGVTTIHHSEHVHVGLCFPYAETWNQANNARTLNFRVVFHNVTDYTVSTFSGQLVDANNSGGGFSSSPAQIAQLQSAMDASATGTTTTFLSYTMSTVGTSCRKTFKPTMHILAANSNAVVQDWSTGGQATTYISYAGQAACTPEYAQDQIRARDWVPNPNMGYIYSTVYAPPASQMSAPVTNPWVVNMASSNQTVDLAIDPDFHSHDPSSPDGDNWGLWSDHKGTIAVGPFTETIPLDSVPGGQHRLVYLGTRQAHRAVVVIPFTKALVCQ